MDIFNDFVIQASAIFFIFLAIFWFFTNKNLNSKMNPTIKRLIQYGMFLLIILLVIFIFKNHSAHYIEKYS
jgi:hypothetical protein